MFSVRALDILHFQAMNFEIYKYDTLKWMYSICSVNVTPQCKYIF